MSNLLDKFAYHEFVRIVLQLQHRRCLTWKFYHMHDSAVYMSKLLIRQPTG